MIGAATPIALDATSSAASAPAVSDGHDLRPASDVFSSDGVKRARTPSYPKVATWPAAVFSGKITHA